MIFELSATAEGFIAGRIENAASGHGWAAPGSGIGPSCMIGETPALFGPGDSGRFELTASEVLPGMHGADSASARWVRKDGLELHWRVTRSPAEAVMELQAELKNTGAAPVPDVRSISALVVKLSVPAADLLVHSVTRNDYRKHATPAPARVTGGSWNSPSSAGWVAVENPGAREVLFLGVEWEGYWTVSVTPGGPGECVLQCSLDTQDHELAPGSSLLSPKVFLGLSAGDIDDSLRVLHDHVRAIMPAVPKDFPWLSYDIWATEAQGVEEAIVSEIPVAAGLGVDLFYIDAGWYEGSDRSGAGNWFAGVGNYAAEDRAKYPGGLASISKKVHDAGMKFGLWFAPQIVDAKLVGSLIPDAFVARKGVSDIRLSIWNTPVVQVCTGNPEVVEHLKKMMGDAVERYSLDWLKWDNSGLPGPVCDRADHGHQAEDGALAALEGQYEIWLYLRRRFPGLMLEECGYPSRLDYGLARTATSHWLSDSTGSAMGVRQGQIHASYVYPAAHNEAMILDGENARDAPSLDTVVRSRMMGQCGMGTLHGKLSERASLHPPEVREALSRNFKVYKLYRHLLRQDVYHLLPPSTEADAWDAIQFCRRDGREAVILVFRGMSSVTEAAVAPRGLGRDVVYEMRSVNSGEVRSLKGKDLAKGVKIALPAPNMSEILLLKAGKGPKENEAAAGRTIGGRPRTRRPGA
jgi:alpha-galactosidase